MPSKRQKPRKNKAVRQVRQKIAAEKSATISPDYPYINGACHATLHTVELLEQILICLPVPDIWRSQRVCRQFQATIARSVALREAMMFRAGDRSTAERLDVRGYPGVDVFLCPLLRVSPKGKVSTHGNSPGYVGESRLGWAPRVDRALGRWRNMKVLDPPCCRVVVEMSLDIGAREVEVGTRCARLSLTREVRRAKGLRMRDLLHHPLTMDGRLWYSSSRAGMKQFQSSAMEFLAECKEYSPDKGKAVLNVKSTKVFLFDLMAPTSYAEAGEESTSGEEETSGDEEMENDTAAEDSRDKVFHTVELLEHILLHLPGGQLFNSQRVCKQFQATISQSPFLQESMMLRSSGTPPQDWSLVGPSCVYRDAHALGNVFFNGPPPRQPNDGHIWVRWNLTPIMRLCSLLKIPPRKKVEASYRLGQHNVETIQFARQLDLDDVGSWKDVLITDPPCLQAQVKLQFGFEVTLDGNARHTRIEVQKKISRSEGLRMADLLRLPLETSWHYASERNTIYEWERLRLKRFNPIPVIAELRRQPGVKAFLKMEQSEVVLCDMVITSEKDRQFVERMDTEEASEEESMSDGDDA